MMSKKTQNHGISFIGLKKKQAKFMAHLKVSTPCCFSIDENPLQRRSSFHGSFCHGSKQTSMYIQTQNSNGIFLIFSPWVP